MESSGRGQIRFPTKGRQSTDSKVLLWYLFCPILCVSTEAIKLCVDMITRPRRPRRTGASPFPVCARRSIHTVGRLRALRLTLPLAHRFSMCRAEDALRAVPVRARWPATDPHACTEFSALRPALSAIRVLLVFRTCCTSIALFAH